MAKEKYVIVSSCRLDGQHVAKGTILEMDLEHPQEGAKIALLNRNGRIALATKANVAAVQSELESERKTAQALSSKAVSVPA